jgi:hypothetical protein
VLFDLFGGDDGNRRRGVIRSLLPERLAVTTTSCSFLPLACANVMDSLADARAGLAGIGIGRLRKVLAHSHDCSARNTAAAR